VAGFCVAGVASRRTIFDVLARQINYRLLLSLAGFRILESFNASLHSADAVLTRRHWMQRLNSFSRWLFLLAGSNGFRHLPWNCDIGIVNRVWRLNENEILRG
jgi:hypothetical protein